MQRRFAKLTLTALVMAGLAVFSAFAQENGDQSRFEKFLENLVSTPDRRISITGLEGAFSSNPSVERITVSDREGAWLELDGVEMVWRRAALLDRMLHIDSLRARQVTVLRKPLAPEETGGGGSGMPVAVLIDAIALPRVILAADVAGGEAELAAAGSAQLTPEALAGQLSVYRQDRAGTLTAELRLEPAAQVLTADLALEEPAGGLIAELMGLPNKPAISAKLSGEGPLDDWKATLTAAANGETVLDGSVAVSRVDDAYRVAADMSASLETLAPADYAALVAGQSALALGVSRTDAGVVTIDAASLRSAGMDLSASGVLSADLVPESAMLSLRLGQAGRTALPFAPGDVSVGSLQVNGELQSGTAAPWQVNIVAEGVESTFGSLGRLAANANGEAENLSRPAQRSTTFRLNGTLAELTASDPNLQAAIGQDARIAAEGSWSAGHPVEVADLKLILGEGDATATFAGTASAERLDGSFGATVSDLSRLAGLAGQALAGSAQVKADGTATTVGLFDLRLEGQTANLKLGIGALDPLLAGTATVQGGMARSADGLAFENLTLANTSVNAEVNGSFADPTLDLSVTADLADLSLVTDRASGGARITATLSGTSDAPRVEAEATGDEVVLMGRPLTGAAARFSGVVAGPDTAGEAEISGTLGETQVRGSARLSAGEAGTRVVENLSFAVGESRATGDLTIGGDGLFTGDLDVVSPDLSKVAPLFLVDASGMLKAKVSLTAEDGSQSAVISGTATDVAYENVTLQSAEIEGRGRDLFGVPQIEGDFSLRNLNAGGLQIVTAAGTAARRDGGTVISARAQLADGSATLEAGLEPRDGGLAIGLNAFTFARSGIDVSLASPTTIAVRDGSAQFDGARLNAGGGSVTITGRAGGEALDLTVLLNALPAALANAFFQGLGAEGTISGRVAVSGTASAPVARFQIDMAGASLAASRGAGVGALGVSAEGGFAGEQVKLTGKISGADGLAVNVAGTVGTGGNAPLDLAVNGSVPLSLGNTQLAARGAAFRGALNVDIKVTGTASSPQYAGRITSEGSGFVDPASGIVLSNLSLAANISNNQLVIERLNAKSGEGTVSAQGSLGLDPKAGLPVDIKVEVRRARYVNGTLVAATLDANLALNGRLTESAVLAGNVTLDRTEITVPSQLPGDSVAVTVEHIDPPPPVERTLQIVRADEDQSTGGGGPSNITLAILVDAPRQIFVRGRGLDTELGGTLRLRGPITSVVTSGSFEIIRGRLDILTQRITLSRGVVTFTGDLDPILDFVGTTQSGDVTITVTIAGRASDPQVTFTSVPDLPQDEILAQLIFRKGIGELSPVQIARLGAAAAELSGGGGGGLLSQLRASTGLDDLDIIVDEEGQAALAAGRYISDNVYLGVEQGATAESSRVTIDLDITKSLKARAGYSARGESSLGLYFEREY